MSRRTKEELHEIIQSNLQGVDYSSRKMFGGLAFFINRNMFTGTHQADLFVRLSAEDREEVLSQDGITVFEPRKGMVMSEYVVLSDSVIDTKLKELIQKSISYVSTLPPKEPRRKRSES
ncbi:MAG: TfoX/Sxy family protein [Candidatus Thorarchaeota archaeon]|jgi:TfoX/Sxy family transcriptional regulator of competence genes